MVFITDIWYEWSKISFGIIALLYCYKCELDFSSDFMSLDFFLNRAIYVLKLLVDSYKIAYIFIEPIKVPLSGVTKLTILCFLMVS